MSLGSSLDLGSEGVGLGLGIMDDLSYPSCKFLHFTSRKRWLIDTLELQTKMIPTSNANTKWSKSWTRPCSCRLQPHSLSGKSTSVSSTSNVTPDVVQTPPNTSSAHSALLNTSLSLRSWSSQPPTSSLAFSFLVAAMATTSSVAASARES